MISTSEFHNGLVFEYEGTLYQILEFLHVKPGKGPAFVRTKLRDMRRGANIDKTFRAGEKMEKVFLETREMEYLYKDGESYVFMDNKTYEQTPIPGGVLGGTVDFLMENTVMVMQCVGDEIIGVELPNFMELEIVETDPGMKGNTAQGGSKPAKLKPGAVVNVPLFVQQGETIRVNTKTREYMDRVR